MIPFFGKSTIEIILDTNSYLDNVIKMVLHHNRLHPQYSFQSPKTDYFVGGYDRQCAL